MKTPSALLILFLLFPTIAFSQDTPVPSRAEVLKAIQTFAESSTSAEGRRAAAAIATFADKSPDVLVVISPKITPWIHNAEPPKFSTTLLAAYIVGNVKSQLDRGTKANDSYAGLQQVLKTYAQLKEADKTLDIPEIQKFADLEAKKQLKKYVEEALKEDKK